MNNNQIPTALEFLHRDESGVYNEVDIVQAMDEYKEEINIQNLKLAVDIAINNGYRLSYQIHKDLGIE